MKLLGPQDLKKKYKAEWALVTVRTRTLRQLCTVSRRSPIHLHAFLSAIQGGSSGIGRAIVDRLAAQGLNIVMVAVDDALLKDSVAQLKAQFPKQEVGRGSVCTCFFVLSPSAFVKM